MLLFYVTPEGWARFSGTCPPRCPCQGQEAGPRSSRPAPHFPLHQGRLRLLASGACRGAYSSRRRSPSADSSPSFARPAVAAARKQQLKPSTSRVRVQTNRPEEGTWQGQCSTHTAVMQKGLGPASSPQPTGAGRGCSRSSAKSAKSWSICGIRSPFRGAGSLTKSHHLWNQCGAGWFGRWKEEQSFGFRTAAEQVTSSGCIQCRSWQKCQTTAEGCREGSGLVDISSGELSTGSDWLVLIQCAVGSQRLSRADAHR